MKYNIFNIDGKVIKKDDTILIKEKKYFFLTKLFFFYYLIIKLALQIQCTNRKKNSK